MRVLLFVAMLVVAQLWAHNTRAQDADDDQSFIEGLIEDTVSSDDMIVRVINFDGALSSEATVGQITIADPDGVWLELTDLTLQWNRSALLRGRVEIDKLAAQEINLIRLPIPSDSTAELPSAQATPFALPDLPVSIEITEVSAAQIILTEALLGEPVTAQFLGALTLSGGAGDADIELTRTDTKTGRFDIDAAFDNGSQQLTLNLLAEEGENGIAARMIDLEGRPSLRLTITGDAPLDDFEAQISLATSGEDRVTGTVRTGTPDGTSDRSFGADLSGDLQPLLPSDYDPFFGSNAELRIAGTQFDGGGLVLTDIAIASQQLQLNGSLRLDQDNWPVAIDLDGQLSSQDGSPVVLPVSGAATQVSDVSLDVTYDTQSSDTWIATFDVSSFAQGEISSDALQISGGGTLTPGAGDARGRFTADLDFAATGISLGDPALDEALGNAISGTLSMARLEGEPFVIRDLSVFGAGLETRMNAILKGPEDRFWTRASINVSATDFSRFSSMTGLNLGGQGDVVLVGDMQPFDGIFDLTLEAATSSLEVGIVSVDPLIDGQTDLSLRFDRDETGTRLRNLDLSNDAVDVTGQIDLTGRTVTADLVARLSDLNLITPDLSGPATFDATVITATDGVVTLDTTLNAPNVAGQISGTATPQTEGFLLAGVADINADDLSDYADLVGLPLKGGLRATVTGQFVTETGAFQSSVDATTLNLDPGIAPLRELLRGVGSIMADATRSPAGVLQLTDLAVVFPNLTAEGSASVDGEDITADFTARLADLKLIESTLSGPATLEAAVGTDASGVIVADAVATAQDARVTAQGTAQPQGDGFLVNGDAQLALSRLSSFQALIGQPLTGAVTADVSGTYNTLTTVFQTELSATTQDFDPGIAPLGDVLAGIGRIEATAQQSAAGVLSVRNLDVAYPNLTASGNAMLDAGHVSADITGALANLGLVVPSLSGSATISADVVTDADGVISLDLEATGPQASANATGTARPQSDGYRVSGTADASVDNIAAYRGLIGQPVSGAVDVSVAGTYDTVAQSLQSNVTAQTLNLNAGIAQLDPILAGRGAISANVSLSEEGRLRLDALSVDFPNLSAEGTVASSGADTTAALTARLSDVALIVPDFSGPLTADVSARQDATGWQLSAQADGPAGVAANTQGRVGNDGQLNLNVTGSAPLALANLYIAPRSIEGLAQFDLSIDGPAAIGSVRGPVTISDARLSAPTLNQALEGIAGTIQLAGGTARLDLRGTSAAGGDLTVTGPLGLTGTLQSALAIRLGGIVLRDPTLYRTSVDGEITITGPLSGGASIAGVLNLDGAEIQVPSTGVSALGSLPDVTHLGARSEVVTTLSRAGLTPTNEPESATNAGSGPAYPLDITLNAPSRIFIRGRGLDAELGGSLRVMGTTENVIPIGRFDLTRGRLDILGQRFELDEGYAQMQGDFSPFIRLVATTEASTGTTVSIIVEGPADAIEVSFESSPELPQDEVLAQLLFGRDLSSISPLQAVQLASAVATLSGRGGGAVNNLRQELDLDDLDFTTDEDGNAAVRAGKYISDNVYTDVTVGVTGETEINLNIDVTDSLTARGSVASDGETSVGLFYEQDY